MRQIAIWFACGLGCLGASAIDGPNAAHARPLYMTVFREVYPNRDDNRKCNVCHIGTDKRKRNEYGEAVKEALEGTNVKDKEAVKAALKKAEDKLPKPKK